LGQLSALRNFLHETLTRPVVAALIGSRLIVLGAAVLAELLPGRTTILTSGSSAPLLASLTSWDGWYYVGIARDGYHSLPVAGAYHDYAFLPGYPALVALCSLGQSALMALMAVILSNALFVLALALLIRVSEPVVGRDVAVRSAVLLALCPFGAVFSMAYGESLFLALSLGAFLAAQRDRRALTGVLLGLAALTRLQGILLIIPLGLIFLLRDRRLRVSLTWLALGPAAVAAFIGYVAILSGSLDGYSSAMAAWGRGGASVARSSSDTVASALSGPYVAYFLLLLFVLAAGVFLLGWLRWDRIPLPYALLPVLYLGAAFASGGLESIGRYLMLAFPYAWILAGRRNRLVAWGLPLIGAVSLFVISFASYRGFFVP